MTQRFLLMWTLRPMETFFFSSVKMEWPSRRNYQTRDDACTKVLTTSSASTIRGVGLRHWLTASDRLRKSSQLRLKVVSTESGAAQQVAGTAGLSDCRLL